MQIPNTPSEIPKVKYKKIIQSTKYKKYWIQNTLSKIPGYQNKENSDKGEADYDIADHADVENLKVAKK